MNLINFVTREAKHGNMNCAFINKDGSTRIGSFGNVHDLLRGKNTINLLSSYLSYYARTVTLWMIKNWAQ
ncbi:unnamed protein product [Brugia timori]|uniref:Uncharacterized protein n=1 Tax=Brugia timori TaxID=42155 RepID=A0A0R3R037_9BILA|nr:unnamed protein product [Brugia timori]